MATIDDIRVIAILAERRKYILNPQLLLIGEVTKRFSF